MAQYRTENPATGEVEKEFDALSAQDAGKAVDRSQAAFERWRGSSVQERADVLRKTADEFERRTEAMAQLIAREMGKPLEQGRAEIGICVGIFRYYADNAEGLLAPQELDPQGARSSVVEKMPLGVLVGVMPWNFPYYQVARFAAPNILLGNTMLLKPAGICAASCLVIDEFLTAAGLPEDVFQPFFADPDQIQTALEDPRVRGVSLTGSEAAGAKVAEGAGRNLKKSLLELGGSDPMIVLDGDIEAIASTAATARLSNAGQACNSPKRMIVLEEHYERFLGVLVDAVKAAKVGNPLDEETDMGPLSSTGARDTLVELLEDATSKGVTVHTGGSAQDGPGAFMEPTVLTGVTREMRAFEEELFGPVAVVYKVKDVEEAVQLANDTPFGLSGSVWSADPEKAAEVARRIDAGMVYVNEHGTTKAGLPFGGVKRSGYGRELAEQGVREFVNERLVRVADAL